jgi:hypothetical protein
MKQRLAIVFAVMGLLVAASPGMAGPPGPPDQGTDNQPPPTGPGPVITTGQQITSLNSRVNKLTARVKSLETQVTGLQGEVSALQSRTATWTAEHTFKCVGLSTSKNVGTGKTVSCAPYICLQTTGHCARKECASVDDCAQGFVCNSAQRCISS